MEVSEPFSISFANIHESLSIYIDEITNCKYNINHQEIPLNHIWNERNHLLHCSFTFEMINNNQIIDQEQQQYQQQFQFKCRLRAYQSNNNILIIMNINQTNVSRYMYLTHIYLY